MQGLGTGALTLFGAAWARKPASPIAAARRRQVPSTSWWSARPGTWAAAQALCMKTQDFRRAFEAFAEKRQPVFGGD
jgi:hypothetical protein